MSRQEELAVMILQEFDSMTTAEIKHIRKQFLSKNPHLPKKVKKFIGIACKLAITRVHKRQTA